MRFFNKLKLAFKLPAIMIGLTMMAIIVSGVVSFNSARKSLLTEAEVLIQTVIETRKDALQNYLGGVESDIVNQSTNPTLLSAIRAFGQGWRVLENQTAYLQDAYIRSNPNPVGEKHQLMAAEDGSAYSQVHRLYHPYFLRLQQTQGYYDIFLFDTDGNLVYSVFKELDYATNFIQGPYRDSGLAEVLQLALTAPEKTAHFVDFEQYAPSNDAPAAFISTPIYDAQGQVAGVLAYQMPIDIIDALVADERGLGDQGDAYLVGQDGLLRSNTRFAEESEILAVSMESTAITAAQRGETGRMLSNEPSALGDHVEHLAAYAPLSFLGTDWALVVDAPTSQIIAPAVRLRNTMLWQGGLMILGVAVIAFFLARSISRPLTRVGKAMETVSDGDYTVEVPGTDRGDEIGGIAGALENFRGALAAAEQSTRDGLFKGAAFEGSSAALMMMNNDFIITFTNAAMQDLLVENTKLFRERYPSFDPKTIQGLNIDIFHGRPEHIRRILSDPSNFPYHADMKMGESYFALVINSVLDGEGQQIGCVIEWSDVTDERKRSAFIEMLDTNQAKAEFKLDGTLTEANDKFATMLGATPDVIMGRRHESLFEFDPALAEERGPVWERVLAGRSVYGRFRIKHPNGHETVLEGAFSPVKDSTGKPFRVILLGNDISASQRALAQAEAERAEMEKAQNLVVDGLRVGLKKLADGDLTAVIEEKFANEYEQLRDDFNAAIRKLHDAMQSVVENADMIRGEAGEISNAADDLSRRTEKQAATLEETATALDQLTSSVRSAADGASQAAAMVAEAKTNAETSGKVVQEAVEAMSAIEQSSDQISKITSVIDDIAFQTNLLALNAGVEAARAGEAGRGFAVVASEVRALAQRSSDAAREINDLISKSGSHVKRGVELVGDTGSALRGIVASVSEIAGHVEEIAVSAREQSSGLAEINSAVNQLDQVTQQNAAMFEETTAASHALTREAETLNNTTAIFRIIKAQTAADNVVRSKFSSERSSQGTHKVSAGPTAAAVGADFQNDSDGWEDF